MITINGSKKNDVDFLRPSDNRRLSKKVDLRCVF